MYEVEIDELGYDKVLKILAALLDRLNLKIMVDPDYPQSGPELLER